MKKPSSKPPVQVPSPGAGAGTLKAFGGSTNDEFNNIVVNQALAALWMSNSDDTARSQQFQATLAAMMGLKPADELEGMLAAQLVAAHAAAMECYRRAMLGEQTPYGRESGLKHGAKLSRVYTELLQALDKHRGKGQQHVKVEHVHIHEGGRAIVGTVTQGGGVPLKSGEEPHAPRRIAHEPGQALPCEIEADGTTLQGARR